MAAIKLVEELLRPFYFNKCHYEYPKLVSFSFEYRHPAKYFASANPTVEICANRESEPKLLLNSVIMSLAKGRILRGRKVAKHVTSLVVG